MKLSVFFIFSLHLLLEVKDCLLLLKMCCVMFPQELCVKGGHLLHMKSSLVEEAANELINMLLEFEQKQEEEEKFLEESRTESKVTPTESDGVFFYVYDTHQCLSSIYIYILYIYGEKNKIINCSHIIKKKKLNKCLMYILFLLFK